MNYPENLPLLRNYLNQPCGSDRFQYAVAELNRQLSLAEITREELLHDLGYATVHGADCGCDAQGLAEQAFRDFPSDDVSRALANFGDYFAHDAVRHDNPELFGDFSDFDEIVNGYIDACSDLAVGKSRAE